MGPRILRRVIWPHSSVGAPPPHILILLKELSTQCDFNNNAQFVCSLYPRNCKMLNAFLWSAHWATISSNTFNFFSGNTVETKFETPVLNVSALDLSFVGNYKIWMSLNRKKPLLFLRRIEQMLEALGALIEGTCGSLTADRLAIFKDFKFSSPRRAVGCLCKRHVHLHSNLDTSLPLLLSIALNSRWYQLKLNKCVR